MGLALALALVHTLLFLTPVPFLLNPGDLAQRSIPTGAYIWHSVRCVHTSICFQCPHCWWLHISYASDPSQVRCPRLYTFLFFPRRAATNGDGLHCPSPI